MPKRFRFRGIFAAAAFVAGSAFACQFLVTQGIHFNGYKFDFGAPPSRYQMYFAEGLAESPAWRPGTIYYGNTDSWEKQREYDPDKFDVKVKRTFADNYRLEENHEFKAALASWKFAAKKKLDDPWFLEERILCLQSFLHTPNAKGLDSYLKATRLEKNAVKLPAPRSVDPRVAAFISYDLADRETDSKKRASQFLAAHLDYPKSVLADSALIMAVRAGLELGAADIHKDPDRILSVRQVNETLQKAQLDKEKTAVALRALHILTQDFPKSRFSNEALGWEGRFSFLQQDYKKARGIYLKQVRLLKPTDRQIRPFDSLLACDNALDDQLLTIKDSLLKYLLCQDDKARLETSAALDERLSKLQRPEAKQLHESLVQDPELLCSYLDYRIDSRTITPLVVTLSKTNGRTITHSKYAAHIFARLAQASYDLSRWKVADEFAHKSLAAGAKGNDAALSMFVQASELKRTGKKFAAIERYKQLIAMHSKSYLVGGALENLAILYETTYRYGMALDIYRKQDYSYDVAYLIDIRMTPDQLRDYIDHHRKDPFLDTLHYSLGLRLLRKKRYDEAITEFQKISSAKRRLMIKKYDDKYFGFDPWAIVDPVKTAKDLRRLSNREESTSGQQKAKALIALGDYLYKHGDLLFYNPLLWDGSRSQVITFSWNGSIAKEADKRALLNHHWEHECFAQALLAYSQAIDVSRGSRLGFHAAYQAGCVAVRLAAMNPYWRELDDHIQSVSKAAHFMRFAAKSREPLLRSRARKFAYVFAGDAQQNRMNLLQEKADEKKYSTKEQYYHDDGLLPKNLKL